MEPRKAGFDLPEFYQDIVKEELNVKNVKFTDEVREFTSYTFKPVSYTHLDVYKRQYENMSKMSANI